MSIQAYVLIQTEIGRTGDVAEKVRQIAGVVQADGVIGSYDVIARAEASSTDELGRLVASRIQLIEGITRTLTCPVVDLGSVTSSSQGPDQEND